MGCGPSAWIAVLVGVVALAVVGVLLASRSRSEPPSASTPSRMSPSSTEIVARSAPPSPGEPDGSFVPMATKEQATELLAGLAVDDRSSAPPYSRDAFGGWLDEDGDCLDTRAEVLAAESLVAVGGQCTVTSGRWESPYDGGTVLLTPDGVDIDHLVALANAWESGAWRWNDDRRASFANDLTHPEHLVAVSASINRAKGARSPDQWMIPSRSKETRCAYLVNWVVIKARWGLSITSRELDTLQRGIGSQCAAAS